MKKTNYLLFLVALLTLGLMFATDGTATSRDDDHPPPPVTPGEELFPAVNDTPPRTCELGTKVTVVAGLDGDPAAQFPMPVNCPGENCLGFTGTGPYLRWDFRFTNHESDGSYSFHSNSDDRDEGENRSYAFLSVSNDTQLYFTSPTAVISAPICAGSRQSNTGQSICEVRILEFKSTGSTTNVSYLTSPDLSPRIATAGVKMKKSTPTCLLAGAGRTTGAKGQTVTRVMAQTPGCNYEFDVAPGAQDIVAGSMTTDKPENCSIEEVSSPPEIDGKPTFNLHTGPLNPLSTIGSCQYTYTNTSGGQTKLLCTGCCVQQSTNTCVTKKASTVCKAGT